MYTKSLKFFAILSYGSYIIYMCKYLAMYVANLNLLASVTNYTLRYSMYISSCVYHRD